MAKDSSLEEAVAALRREFAESLPGRLALLRSALDALRRDVTRDTLQNFHRPAHALVGTAGSYDARELSEPVTRLASLARRWLDGKALPPPRAELDEATRNLDALEMAIERYRRRVGSASTNR
ncbi:MAG TPA: Hpt domain-containing protein [Gemmatimonadales bacterium]|nr:Hpt domain-containing protein [Gemmatimonadales bacterium]